MANSLIATIIPTIIVVAASFVIDGPTGIIVAVLGVVARRRFGWRRVGWSAVGLIGAVAALTAMHAGPPPALDGWVSSTVWVQDLVLSAMILLLLALQGAAASFDVQTSRLVSSR